MHIKRIHEMEEKLTEIALCEINKGIECVNTVEMGAVIDMIKDLACAEKEAREAKEMEEEEEEEKKENEYFLKMLKEEHGMSEEDGKRFYDAWRYKSSGRFAPRGKGTRYGQRGYEEPMYHMPLEMYHDYSPEELRDIDREKYGRLYYTPSNSGNSGGQSGNSGMRGRNMSGNSGESTRGYSDGFDDGQRRGYSEGYEQGSRDGRNKASNSRYDRARRGYEEIKEMHKGNTAQDNSENMKGLEELLNVIDGDVKELLPKMSPSEKTMLKQKFSTWAQKVG